MAVPPVPPLDETIVAGQSGHISDHQVIHDALNDFALSIAAGVSKAGVETITGDKSFTGDTAISHVTTLWPFVNVQHPLFGAVGDGVTDDADAFEAAIDYSLDNGGTVIVPGTIDGYFLGHTILIDLLERGGQGRRGVYMMALAGPNTLSPNEGSLVQFTNPPTCILRGPGGGDPMFEVRHVSAYPKFDGFAMINAGPCIVWGGVPSPPPADVFEGDSAGLALPNCSLTSTLTGVAPLLIQGGFWGKFGGSDGFVGFATPDVDTPSIEIVHDTAIGGQSGALCTFENLVLNKGNVLFRHVTAGTRMSHFVFRNVVTENFDEKALLDVVATGAGVDTVGLECVTVDGFTHADQTGQCPIVWVSNCIVTSVVLINAEAAGAAILLAGTGKVYGAINLGQGQSTSQKALIRDGSDFVRGNFISQTWTGWDCIVRDNEGISDWEGRGGYPMRVGRDLEDHAAGAYDGHGGLLAGPGGASGGWDWSFKRVSSSVYRLAGTSGDVRFDVDAPPASPVQMRWTKNGGVVWAAYVPASSSELRFHNGADSLVLDANGKAVAKASATAAAGLCLPHGAAPSAPADGDVWTTTAGLFVRVSGSTVGPLT